MCLLTEERKLAAPAVLCQQSGFKFMPFALETSGGVGVYADSALMRLRSGQCWTNDGRTSTCVTLQQKTSFFPTHQRDRAQVERKNGSVMSADQRP